MGYIFYTDRWQSFSGAYEDAIGSLRGCRGSRITQEHQFNFKRRFGKLSTKPKKPKLSGWTARYYCLSSTESDTIPSKRCTREMLASAGLGEEAQDGGGPRREFFRLFADNVRSTMCIGFNNAYVFKHDVTALQV